VSDRSGSDAQPGLFDAAPPGRAALAARLAELAGKGVLFGTSSWKYAGWLGGIYARQRYLTRGRFSQKKFEAECLREYAETFPAVCGDFSFYQFPTEDYWARLFAGAPAGFQFAFKVPEMITVREWPGHARYGARAGQPNESFLDADLLAQAFLAPLEPYRELVGALIFEFGTFGKRHYEGVESFAGELGRFLDRLPAGFRYSVEIRNREYFDEPYFSTLRERNVAHVHSSWTRMPGLSEQVSEAAARTADFSVARALLAGGRTYEQAVKQFQPYARISEPNPGAREGLKKLMEQALTKRQLAFLFVNNRLEGHAPGTIAAVTGAAYSMEG
jgi:uncharacterized protein YecE (DUF72 family)